MSASATQGSQANQHAISVVQSGVDQSDHQHLCRLGVLSSVC